MAMSGSEVEIALVNLSGFILQDENCSSLHICRTSPTLPSNSFTIVLKDHSFGLGHSYIQELSILFFTASQYEPPDFGHTHLNAKVCMLMAHIGLQPLERESVKTCHVDLANVSYSRRDGNNSKSSIWVLIRPSQSKHIKRSLRDDVCVGRHCSSASGKGKGAKSGRPNLLVSSPDTSD